MNKIIDELKSRGLLRETFGPAEENFKAGEYFYVGTDPTSDSLGVHHMVAFTTAKLLQQYGMRPIVLIGSATASLGDPSFKDDERAIIPMETIMHNTECIKKQIEKILDFDETHENHAIFVNNFDWMNNVSFLDFMRDVGKRMTVNYMMAKDSVKTRISREGKGLSFCEFGYSCIQGYDFIHLYEEYGCKNQIGGVDQTGNIDSAFVLGHKRNKIDCLSALVWDLITDSTGKKFGKSEGNAVWLDPKKTSPYQFMQFWLNLPDADAESMIKKFTLIPLDEINDIIAKHHENPGARLLQRELAKYLTCLVHSEDDYNKALEASEILFGKATTATLEKMDEQTFLDVMKDVNKAEINRDNIKNGISILDLAIMHDKIQSKGEARKLIKSNGFSLNKQKVGDERMFVSCSSLINDKYILLQKGKKDYTLVVCV
jgi:tyrosyl-tRNA synthetase